MIHAIKSKNSCSSARLPFKFNGTQIYQLGRGVIEVGKQKQIEP